MKEVVKQTNTASQGTPSTNLPEVIPVEKEFLMTLLRKVDSTADLQRHQEDAIKELRNRRTTALRKQVEELLRR